jgi:hypothetical protein
VAARQSRNQDRGMAILAMSGHGQDARTTPHVGPNAVRPYSSCQGALAKWEGGCLQNSPIVGSIPTRASTVVSTGVRAGLISL